MGTSKTKKRLKKLHNFWDSSDQDDTGALGITDDDDATTSAFFCFEPFEVEGPDSEISPISSVSGRCS